MTTPDAATTVHHEIVVNAPIARAFSVFTEDFGSFKPPEHNLLGVEIAETVFEPRAGGRLYDRGVDGSECNWARVLAYDPPTASSSAGTSTRDGRSRPIPRRPARSRSDSLPKHPSARASNSSTVTSTATSRAGRPSATASTPKAAGRCTCSGSPNCSTGSRQADGNSRLEHRDRPTTGSGLRLRHRPRYVLGMAGRRRQRHRGGR